MPEEERERVEADIWPLLGELRTLTERLERAVAALIPDDEDADRGYYK